MNDPAPDLTWQEIDRGLLRSQNLLTVRQGKFEVNHLHMSIPRVGESKFSGAVRRTCSLPRKKQRSETDRDHKNRDSQTHGYLNSLEAWFCWWGNFLQVESIGKLTLRIYRTAQAYTHDLLTPGGNRENGWSYQEVRTGGVGIRTVRLR